MHEMIEHVLRDMYFDLCEPLIPMLYDACTIIVIKCSNT